VQAAVHGPAAALGQVGAGDSAMVLTPVQATLAAVAVRHGVGGPAQQQLLQLLPAEHRGQLAGAEAGGQQADAAGDVEPDPTWRILTPPRLDWLARSGTGQARAGRGPGPDPAALT